MPVSNTEPALSPSLHHRQLMDSTQPSMSFDGGDVAEWQAKLRPKVRSLVGMPSGDRIALNPRTLWKRDVPHGSIEKIVFHSEPGSDIVAFLCLPSKRDSPVPLLHLRPRTHDRRAPFDSRRARRQPRPHGGRRRP